MSRILSSIGVFSALLCLAGAPVGAATGDLSALRADCRSELYRTLRLSLGTDDRQFLLLARDRELLLASEQQLPELADAVMRILVLPGRDLNPSSLANDAAAHEAYLERCREGGRAVVDSLFVESSTAMTEGRGEPGGSRLDRVLASLGLGDAAVAAPRIEVEPTSRSELATLWGFELARFPEAHRLSRGERVLVAIVGSGLDPESPLVANLAIDERGGSVIGGLDAASKKESDRPSALVDETGTGTVMAALVGVSAPAADILPIRIADPIDSTFPYWHARQVAHGIHTAVALGARVIVVGASFDRDFDFLRDACRDAYDHHAVVVAPSVPPPDAPLDRMSSFPAHSNLTLAVAGAVATEHGPRGWSRWGNGSHYTSIAAPATLGPGDPPRPEWGAAIAGGLVALVASRLPPTADELRGQYFQRIHEIVTRAANAELVAAHHFAPEVGYGFVDAAAAVGPELEAYREKMHGIEQTFAARLEQVNAEQDDDENENEEEPER